MKPNDNSTVIVIDDHEIRDRNRKRGRREVVAREDSDVVIMRDTADSDIDEISPHQSRRASQALGAQKRKKSLGRRAANYSQGNELNLENEDDSGDVIITACIGQDAGRDLPHLRPDCTVHRFNFGVFKSNYRHCAQCYCYACDVKASECQFWGTGLNDGDHANARPLVHWNRMRMAARQGRALHASATAAVATAAAVTGGNNACGDQARSGGQVETQTANRRRVDNGKKTPKTSEADCQKSLEAAAAALTALITRVAALEKRNSALVRTHASARAPAVMHAAVVATAPHRSASPTSSTEGCIGRRSPR